MKEYKKPSIRNLFFEIEDVLSSSQATGPLDFDTDINDTID